MACGLKFNNRLKQKHPHKAECPRSLIRSSRLPLDHPISALSASNSAFQLDPVTDSCTHPNFKLYPVFLFFSLQENRSSFIFCTYDQIYKLKEHQRLGILETENQLWGCRQPWMSVVIDIVADKKGAKQEETHFLRFSTFLFLLRQGNRKKTVHKLNLS